MSRKITIVSFLCLASWAPSFAAHAQEPAPHTAPAQPAAAPTMPTTSTTSTTSTMPTTPTTPTMSTMSTTSTTSTTPPPPTAAGEAPIWAGTVEAPPVQSAPPPPPPPPGSYAGAPHAPPCADGQCVQRCRYGRCWYERAPQPDDGRRHTGLLLRATSGWGLGPLSGTASHRHEGSLALGVAFDVGSAVIENLIVRGRFRASALGFSDGDFGDDVLFSFGAIGAGVDYYIMPANIYLGATLSVVGAARSSDKHTLHSKAGFGVDLDVGKEWWLGNHWGVGLAVRATLDQVGGANIEYAGSLQSFHVGLQFSATYD